MITTWPRENIDCKLSSEDCNMFRRHCSRQMYQVGHQLPAFSLASIF